MLISESLVWVPLKGRVGKLFRAPALSAEVKLFKLTDKLEGGLVMTAVIFGVEPHSYNFKSLPAAKKPAAQTQNIGVVVAAGKTG